MSNITPYYANLVLDWSMVLSSPTPPTAIYCGLASAVPTSSSASELSTSVGYTRYLATFSAAASGSTANSNNIAFGPFTSATTVYGLQLWDNATVGSGNMLWFGALNSPIVVAVGSLLAFTPGALTLSIS